MSSVRRDDPVAVPAAVRAVAAGQPLELVWRNDLGGLTFALGDAHYIKWAPHGETELDIAGEVRRLRWAGPFTPVPRVVADGSDTVGAWMITEALPGRSAVDERWRAEPRIAVTAIGRGLRALHDALPVAGCPFSWSVESRLPLLKPADRARVAAHPPIDRLVVCHGDACAPNTLIGEDGEWVAHVDLGMLGTADRWADIAIATWSTQWNYGPGWEPTLLQAYGIDPDPVRTAYYRALWDPDRA